MTLRARRNGRNSFHLSKSPSHLLRHRMQRANDLFVREPGASELTKQQFIVFAAVEQNEGVSQTELVAITGLDRSTFAEMIEQRRGASL